MIQIEAFPFTAPAIEAVSVAYDLDSDILRRSKHQQFRSMDAVRPRFFQTKHGSSSR